MKKYLIPISLLFVLIIAVIYYYSPKNIQITVNSGIATSTTEKSIVEKTDFYTINTAYPIEVLDTSGAMERFVKYQVAQKKEDWKIGGETYKAEQQTNIDFPDRPKMEYQYFISYTKAESKKFGTVSYVFSTYEFTGGANGNTTITTFTFDKTGQLAIDAIINFVDNNNDIALSRVLSDKIYADAGAYSDREMIDSGLGLAYLKPDGVTLDKEKCHCDGFFFPSNFQNFVINDGGITFVFSEYQVAPGSSGAPEFTLDWETLKPYLTTQFKNTYKI